MKKLSAVFLSFIIIISLFGCGGNDSVEISITVPAQSSDEFVYSEEELCSLGEEISVLSGKGLGDTLVVLKSTDSDETEYTPTYITHGFPTKFSVKKGACFKIGISAPNQSDSEKTYSLDIEGAKIKEQ